MCNGNALSAHSFAQKLHFSVEKSAFPMFKFQIMFTETEEDPTKGYKSIWKFSSKINYVIQVQNDFLASKTPEDQLYCPVKCCWGSAQPHG